MNDAEYFCSMNYRTGKMRIWGRILQDFPCGCGITMLWCDELEKAQAFAHAGCTGHIDMAGSGFQMDFEKFDPRTTRLVLGEPNVPSETSV